MPKDITSPFLPGIPVPIESFIGRTQEIDRIKSKVKDSLSGRIQVEFLVGERGIGKTSLAAFLAFLCSKELDFQGIHVFLGGVDSLEEFAKKVIDSIIRESARHRWFDKIRNLFGKYVSSLDLYGVKLEFNPPPEHLTAIVNDFASTLESVFNKLQPERKGLLLILDDINGLSSTPQFANWLKSFVDDFAVSARKMPLTIMLVGYEEKRQALIKHNSSLARVFDPVLINPWLDNENSIFFADRFRSVEIHVDEDALELMCKFTGGLPVLAHEIGDAVFQYDNDNHIDEDDALAGVIQAADIVGRKYMETQVFTSIRSTAYRELLKKIVHSPLQEAFSKADIAGKLSASEEKKLANFLNRMVALNVLQREKELGAGWYKFRTRLHCLYLWLEKNRAERQKETSDK